MKRIHLQAVRLRAFRSFLELTNVDFGPAGGLRMLYGVNEVEPRLDGNGAGKSTLWDAICWCFYNFSARNLRAAELTSWGSDKPPYVGVELTLNGAPILIERHGSPNRLLMDGQPIEQEQLERDILGLSRVRFMHSVLFGQMVRLFVDLTVPERGALLDEVLDLGLWLRASAQAGTEAITATNEIARLERDLAHKHGCLEGLPDATSLQAQADSWNAMHDQRLEEALAELGAAEAELATYPELAPPILPAVDKLETNLRTQEQLVADARGRLMVMEADYKRLRSLVNFFEAAPETCPTCAQAISRRFAGLEARTHSVEAEALHKEHNELQREKARLDEAVPPMRALIRQRQQEAKELYAEHRAALERRKAAMRRVEDLALVAERLADEENPFVAQQASLVRQRNALQRGIQSLRRQLGEARAELATLEYWKTGFKKVRLFETARSLDMLHLEVASAAQALGLIGWRMEFATETETKSGTMRQGVQIIVHSPQASACWEAWSGGESQRIRLAIALGLASLVQRMAGAHYEFEVWDEPSAWLSAQGIDDLLGCLAMRADSTGKTIWILDHRALWHAGFAETWQVTKRDTGSIMQRIS
jgi:DNA repair exonuclease SbcCD ATPase subunit